MNHSLNVRSRFGLVEVWNPVVCSATLIKVRNVYSSRTVVMSTSFRDGRIISESLICPMKTLSRRVPDRINDVEQTYSIPQFRHHMH